MGELSEQEQEFLAQQELQKQQFESQAVMNDPYIKQQQAEVQASIIKAISPSAVLKEMEMNLRGQVLDNQNNIIQKYRALMNNLGVSTMMTFARTFLNQNTVISHIEERQVGYIMEALSRDVVLNLQLNWRSFDIQEKTSLDLINIAVLFPCYFSLRRAVMGGERNWLKHSMQESLSGKANNPFEKPGGLKGFFQRFRL